MYTLDLHIVYLITLYSVLFLPIKVDSESDSDLIYSYVCLYYIPLNVYTYKCFFFNTS